MGTPAASHSSSRRILEMATQTHGVVSRSSLLEAGFSRGFIRGRVEAGWLLPLARGVYAVGHPLGSEAAVLAATLVASGRGSAIAGVSAAALWGIHRWNGPVEVVRPGARSPTRFRLERPGLLRPRAVRVRRTARLDPREFRTRAGLRTTNVERTLLDLASAVGDRDLRSAFNEADRLGLLDRNRLLECVAAGRGLPGASSFRRLVETRHPETHSSESELETMFMDLCRRYGLPVPEPNPVVCGYRVDCLWRDQRLIAELDGFEFHRGRMAFERDAARDADLRLAGYSVIRITYEMLVHRPRQTALLVRSQMEPGPEPAN